MLPIDLGALYRGSTELLLAFSVPRCAFAQVDAPWEASALGAKALSLINLYDGAPTPSAMCEVHWQTINNVWHACAFGFASSTDSCIAPLRWRHISIYRYIERIAMAQKSFQIRTIGHMRFIWYPIAFGIPATVPGLLHLAVHRRWVDGLSGWWADRLMG